MNTEQLREYVNIVVDMEQNNYTMSQLEDNMAQSVLTLRRPLPREKEVVVQVPQRKQAVKGGVTGEGVGKAAILGGIIGFVFAILAPGYIPLIPAALIGAILLGFVELIYSPIASERRYQEEVAENERDYRRKMEKYSATVKEETNRINELNQKIEKQEKENLAKADYIEGQLATLKNRHTQSIQNLNKIYDYNVIFPKYRNLIMVCSLCEYLDSGRCTELEGPDGGYNILETEIRLDRIITRLDRIIESLNDIKANQYRAFSELVKSNTIKSEILNSVNGIADRMAALNSKAESIGTEVSKINDTLNAQSQIYQSQLSELQENSTLIAYNAERTQRELHYMNRMNYLAGRNSGAFFNIPPT